MRVLLTSTGLETEEITEYFKKMIGKDMSQVNALFIPTAATDAGAIAVLPKCMNDLLKCGILDKNIKVFDLHGGMELEELCQYDVVYLCGGDPHYLLAWMNETGFGEVMMKYIQANGAIIGVSAGSLIFASNMAGNLGLINAALHVHCAEGEKVGKKMCRLADAVHLTNICALAIREFPDGIEIIGRLF